MHLSESVAPLALLPAFAPSVPLPPALPSAQLQTASSITRTKGGDNLDSIDRPRTERENQRGSFWLGLTPALVTGPSIPLKLLEDLNHFG